MSTSDTSNSESPQSENPQKDPTATDDANMTADEAVLPKVQPPTAGFIFQLFIIPGLIVCIVVLIWLTMNWLARGSNDPREYLEKIRNRSGDRIYAATSLAEVLNDSKNSELLYDAVFAKELGSVLEDEVKLKDKDQSSVSIRSYLCLAAGRFHVNDSLPALIFAADADQEDSLTVRSFALQGILELSHNVRSPLTENLLPSIRETCDQLAKDVNQSANQTIVAKLNNISEQANHLSKKFMQVEDFSAACLTLADDLEQVIVLLPSSGSNLDEENLDYLKEHVAKIRLQAEQAKAFQWDQNEALANVLTQAAQTDDSEYDNQGSDLRARVAFALPLVPGKKSKELLVTLLNDDTAQWVRFNAAAAMARTGDLASREALIEMLDPDMDQFKFKSEAFTEENKLKSIEIQRREKRDRIIMNALKSVRVLAELNSTEPLNDCQQALKTLLSAEQSITSETRVTAKELLEMLEKRNN